MDPRRSGTGGRSPGSSCREAPRIGRVAPPQQAAKSHQQIPSHHGHSGLPLTWNPPWRPRTSRRDRCRLRDTVEEVNIPAWPQRSNWSSPPPCWIGPVGSSHEATWRRQGRHFSRHRSRSHPRWKKGMVRVVGPCGPAQKLPDYVNAAPGSHWPSRRSLPHSMGVPFTSWLLQGHCRPGATPCRSAPASSERPGRTHSPSASPRW